VGTDFSSNTPKSLPAKESSQDRIVERLKPRASVSSIHTRSTIKKEMVCSPVCQRKVSAGCGTRGLVRRLNNLLHFAR
jgi:hypothetical protein